MSECPRCRCRVTVKAGLTQHGKPRRKCKDCGRQFALNPTWRTVPDETIATIDRLLRERLSLRGIARVTGTSLTFVTKRAAKVIAAAPDPASVAPPLSQKGAWWSSAATRCGGLSAKSSSKPGSGWRRNSTAGGSLGCTSAAAARRRPGRSGRACRPSTAPTRRCRPTPGRQNRIESFNNILRQQLGRFTRRTVSFSKSLANHLGCLRYFSDDYDRRLVVT